MGLTEPQANIVYMVLTAGITLSMLFLGGIPDKIGVRRSLFLSLTIMVLGRFLLAASDTFFGSPAGEPGPGLGSPMFFVVLAGVLVTVVGYGAYQPAAYAGVKQFTNKKTSAIGYAMIYALMNLGAFVSGIISPPIRHETGMAGVFWVYVGVTVLAVLSVVFLLTRKTVLESTARVKREDEAFAKEEGTAKKTKDEDVTETKKQDSAPKRSLLEPMTLVLVLLAVGTLLAFLFQLFTAENTDSEKIALDAAKAFESVGGAFDEAHAEKQDPDTSLDKTLRDAYKAIHAAAEACEAPQKSDELEVEPTAFDLLRVRLETRLPTKASLGETVDALRESQSSSLTEGQREENFRLLRAHAVAMMSFAYATVETVDTEVVDSLRLRLKRAEDDDPIPMEAKEVEAIVAEAALEPSKMLAAIQGRYGKLANEFKSTPQALGQALEQVFRFQANFAGKVATMKPEDFGPIASKMLTDFLVTDAMVAKVLAEKFQEQDKPAEDDEKAKPVIVADFLSVIVAKEAGILALEQTGGEFAKAAQAPMGARLQNWLQNRGGAFLVLCIIAVIALGWRVLRLRPDHPFHNPTFTFFIFILIPVQTLFAHNWLTLPLYIDRAFAGTFVGESFEFFSNINPVLIFVLTPLVAALTARANVYRMMVWGTLVMAVPTFLLVLPPTPSMLLLYIFLMSIGEAMWQPRFLQLVADIAPEGKTGAYMGIAQLPWFLTKLVTASYAGFFLKSYCPQVGPQNTGTMWLIYGAIAMVTPIALVFAKGWVAGKITQKH